MISQKYLSVFAFVPLPILEAVHNIEIKKTLNSLMNLNVFSFNRLTGGRNASAVQQREGDHERAPREVEGHDRVLQGPLR